ncbi:MAG: hypothetical protein ABIK52_04220 [Bacteroidota bacterium]
MKAINILLLGVLLMGCQPEQTDTYGHGGESDVHEATSSRVTLFADSLELFLEYGPMVKEEETGFLAHFTILNDDYQPLEGSEVILKVTCDGQTEVIPFKAEDVPGIYHALYTPAADGFSVISVEALFHGKPVVFNLDSVPVYSSDHEVPTTMETHGNLITFTKEQAWKTDFSTEIVVRKPFHKVINTSGQVLPARGDEMLASNTLEKAAADFKLAEELSKENIISRKEFLAAKTAFTEATTRYDALTRNVSSGGKQVFSPISGYFKTVYVHEGDFVSVGQPLAMVSQNRRLVLKADVSPRYTSDLPGRNRSRLFCRSLPEAGCEPLCAGYPADCPH